MNVPTFGGAAVDDADTCPICALTAEAIEAMSDGAARALCSDERRWCLLHVARALAMRRPGSPTGCDLLRELTRE